MDTPEPLATSRGGTQLDKSFFADSILLSVIWRFRTPTRPSFLATSSTARVRSTVSSRSISARLAITTGDYFWRSNTRLGPGKFRPLRPTTTA